MIHSRTSHNEETVKKLQALNDPQHSDFEPSVVFTWDLRDLRLYPWLDRWILQPYIGLARRIVRHETDVVMLSHILLYLTTSVPSAVLLYYRFSWTHGVLHWLMQSY